MQTSKYWLHIYYTLELFGTFRHYMFNYHFRVQVGTVVVVATQSQSHQQQRPFRDCGGVGDCEYAHDYAHDRVRDCGRVTEHRLPKPPFRDCVGVGDCDYAHDYAHDRVRDCGHVQAHDRWRSLCVPGCSCQ